MTFDFQIEDVAEIRKDPIGHHHHWTILYGKLTRGVITRGDRIEIPYLDGLPLAAIVVDFSTLGNSLNVETVQVGDVDISLAVMIGQLAGDSERIGRTQASFCDIERYKVLLLEILHNDPKRFFHCHEDVWLNHLGQKETGCFPCPDCIRPLYQLEEARPILQQLTQHADAYIADAAARILKPPLKQARPTNRKRRWWAFWRKTHG